MTKSGLSGITLLLLSLACTSIAASGQESSTGDAAPAKIQDELLGPGDHSRSMMIGKQKRSYIVHVPPNYDRQKKTPAVLAFHGAAMNGSMMERFSGLSKKADAAGFIVVYPNGTGTGPFLIWNAGGLKADVAEAMPDDVSFIGKMLDDLESVVNVDSRRVFACGMSNGGMMCYRLAAEMSERIAAIAPVAGTIAVSESKPTRPVPVIHFHGLKDNIVPYDIANHKPTRFMKVKGVEDSIKVWVTIDECDPSPKTETLSKNGDEMKVTQTSYIGGKNGSEVVLVVFDEGGHTWPGQQPPIGVIGKSSKNISANDLIWDFFEKHPLELPGQ